jgi:hypothetical protein
MQPAPVVSYQAAPATMAVYEPQPQIIGAIPTSFFTGGITYGAGFPIDQSYSYGGGGFYVAGGGTRFSGVRERAGHSLNPPSRKHHHAPKKKHGCGC